MVRIMRISSSEFALVLIIICDQGSVVGAILGCGLLSGILIAFGILMRKRQACAGLFGRRNGSGGVNGVNAVPTAADRVSRSSHHSHRNSRRHSIFRDRTSPAAFDFDSVYSLIPSCQSPSLSGILEGYPFPFKAASCQLLNTCLRRRIQLLLLQKQSKLLQPICLLLMFRIIAFSRCVPARTPAGPPVNPICRWTVVYQNTRPSQRCADAKVRMLLFRATADLPEGRVCIVQRAFDPSVGIEKAL